MSRAPSPPPALPGYEYVQHIGGGGFADVFLYEQKILGRKVAVKVLLASESSPAVRAQFDAESTLMAALSTHPHIVSIYDASIAADGRPYLIMEYCSRPNLSQRYKAAALPVQDAVSIGIQIGGAVETAHRAGILHRDIKPANVLTTDYHRPALTDFGISVAAGAPLGDDSVGMSIPWSPPEMLSDEPSGDQRADVYSLAATVYTLLARRSPYERPGGPNTAVDLVNRIQRTPLAPVGRPDVPPTLERVLARGMAKDPAARWPSALQFARALQDVQSDLRWPVTQVDVFDENPGAAQAALPPEDDGRTRIRGLVTIHAQAPTESTQRRPAPTVPPLAGPAAAPVGLGHVPVEHTTVRGPVDPLVGTGLAAPPTADTMLRTPAGTSVAEAGTADKPRRWPWFVVGAAAVAIAVTVGIIVLVQGTAPAPLPDSNETGRNSTGETVNVGVPEPDDMTVARSGEAFVFTWTNPDPQPGDTFQWQRTDTNGDQQVKVVTQPTVTVQGGSSACIEVVLVRDNGQYSNPVRTCSQDG